MSSRKKKSGSASQKKHKNASSSASSSSSAKAAATKSNLHTPTVASHDEEEEEEESALDPSDLEQLLAEVEEYLEHSDIGAAEVLLRSPELIGSLRPKDIQPAHASLVPAMELLAQVLLAKRKNKEAYWLRACCSLQADGGAEKWMYFGQLLSGRQALEAFKNGINCMLLLRQRIETALKQEQQRQATGAFSMSQETPEELHTQLQAIDKQISSAYTSMAELYVTDLCDEPNAEQECEKLLKLALASCSDNPDALYALANLRTIQGRLATEEGDEARATQRLNEARTVMTQLFHVLQLCHASSIQKLSVLQVNDVSEDAIDVTDVSYELRVNAAKLALELEAYEPALQLFEQLLDEDDAILEVSHLAAVCAYNMQQFQDALEHIEHAEQLIATEENSRMGGEDEDESKQDGEEDEVDEEQKQHEQEEIDATKRALAELKANTLEALKHAPPEPVAEEEEEEKSEEEEDDDEMED